VERIGHLVRGLDLEAGDVVVGVVQAAGIAPLREPATIAELLRLDTDDFDAAMSATAAPIPAGRLRLLPPIDGATEVWAAGVTYRASREARVEESGDEDVYRRVYEADRPELFFKAPAWRVVTDGEPIATRDDSDNDVPEPEVGLVLNSAGDLVGFTIVDDVSSRSIEGANPLYLPQAKVYDGCCAVGPTIVPRRLVPDETAMAIRMTIRRGASLVFEGESSTSRLKRTFADLARFLFLQMSFPDGAILATGTSVVPPLSSTLTPGDVVEISIDGLGSMVTPVATTSEVGRWLAGRRTRPAAAPAQQSGVTA
jgi:2-dehydro-3-deoxy-D-arabinonate dehydratase